MERGFIQTEIDPKVFVPQAKEDDLCCIRGRFQLGFKEESNEEWLEKRVENHHVLNEMTSIRLITLR